MAGEMGLGNICSLTLHNQARTVKAHIDLSCGVRAAIPIGSTFWRAFVVTRLCMDLWQQASCRL